MLIDVNKFNSINKKFELLSDTGDYFKNKEILNELVNEFSELTAHMNQSCKDLIELNKKISCSEPQ